MATADWGCQKIKLKHIKNLRSPAINLTVRISKILIKTDLYISIYIPFVPRAYNTIKHCKQAGFSSSYSRCNKNIHGRIYLPIQPKLRIFMKVNNPTASVQQTVATAKKAVSSTADKSATAFSTIAAAATGAANATTAASSTLGKAVNSVTSGIKDAATHVTSTVSKAVNSVESGIKEAANETVTLAGDAADEVKTAYGKVASGVSTVASGIGSAASTVASYADSGISAGVQAITALV
ncbi:hypothetical protein [Rhodoferax sp.]|uniref:hypothetical protein n=1 Tax=Rhodoferax sp. TaxID=50421 RepID=UPI00374D32C8